jgi:hypothetical protein
LVDEAPFGLGNAAIGVGNAVISLGELLVHFGRAGTIRPRCGAPVRPGGAEYLC